MKKDIIGFILILILMMCASFYAGYTFSPNHTKIIEQDAEIRNLKDAIVQQQISNSYIMKHLNNLKIKNWSMNKN